MTASFSNPAGAARETGREYVRMLLEVLGDRDPMAVQEATAAALEESVRGLSEQILRRPERPGKWSLLEVVQHLADSELVCGYRMRMILSHDTPDIQGFDQDLWARELRYRDRALSEALEEFRLLRGANLRLLRSLTPAQRRRFGTHSERGTESIEQMVRLYAAHDLVHLGQVERIKNAVKEA